MQPDWLSINLNLAGIFPDRSSQHFHQGALPGPIASDQSVNFTRTQLEIDPLQGNNPSIPHTDLSAIQQRRWNRRSGFWHGGNFSSTTGEE
jgi:hypothetical protein